MARFLDAKPEISKYFRFVLQIVQYDEIISSGAGFVSLLDATLAAQELKQDLDKQGFHSLKVTVFDREGVDHDIIC